MKKFLSTLAHLILIFGIIGSIILAYTLSVTEITTTMGKYDLPKVEEVRSMGLAVGIFLGGVFSSVVLFAILNGLATILEKLDRLENPNAENTVGES